MHGLDRASLAISLDADRFPFDPRYLWGPAPFGIPVLRQFTHEVVHFWSMLGSAYLANIALADWRALSAGTFVEPEGAAASFTRQVPEVGFSPWQLHEAVCRYWDIHIVGPELLLGEPGPAGAVGQELPDWIIEGLEPEVVERLRATTPYTDEQFDRWMALEDDYARPYRTMVERLGSRTSVVLFPLVAYFAFQTAAPCETYAEAVAGLVELRVVPRDGGAAEQPRDVARRLRRGPQRLYRSVAVHVRTDPHRRLARGRRARQAGQPGLRPLLRAAGEHARPGPQSRPAGRP